MDSTAICGNLINSFSVIRRKTMAKIPFKTPYGDRQAYRVKQEFHIASMTRASFLAECDVNRIMDKYQKTGLISHNAKYQGSYGDFMTSADYHECMNAILEAENAFQSLPSSVRTRFQNDPAAFLDFVQDEENIEEMRSLGLLNPQSEKTGDPAGLPSGEEGGEEGQEVGAGATE
ncbi:internal scaffolding protein [Microviridae sp.]|nr:internal scaffolding protein [Microviridae sp.]